ncbi:hypothetical protein GCM10009785_25440 [Brooklawnia cerclae]
MLTVAVVLVLVLVAGVGVWQVSWLGSGRRARAVADLVALSAAHAQQEGRDGCEVAGGTAEGNGARLEECEVTTGYGEFVVDVTVSVRVVPQVPGAPGAAVAGARAGIVADVG